MSRVLVITTSLRAKSNSDRLAEELIRGASEAGHEVGHISLRNKTIGFCRGCLTCQKTQRCVIRDDAVEIAEKVKAADTLPCANVSGCILVSFWRASVESPCSSS